MLALTAVTASLLAFPGVAGAFAPTGNPIADQLLASMEADGNTKASIASATTTGDRTEINGLKSVTTLQDVTSTVRIEHLVLDGARLTDGRIEADAVDAAGIAISGGGGDVTAERIEATSLVVPAPKDAATGSLGGVFKIEGVEFVTPDLTVPVGDFAMSASDLFGGVATYTSLAWTGFTIEASLLPPDDQLRALLTALGYDRLALSAVASGRWDPATATIKTDTMRLTAEDVGTVTFDLTLGNATPAVVREMQAGSTGDTARYLKALESLTIVGGSLTFSNASIVERLLALQAKSAGTTPEVFAGQLAGSLPILLNGLGNPPLQAELAKAGGAFLGSPGAITLTVKPPTPIAVGAIIATTQSAPQTLPALLGATVTATPKPAP